MCLHHPRPAVYVCPHCFADSVAPCLCTQARKRRPARTSAAGCIALLRRAAEGRLEPGELSHLLCQLALNRFTVSPDTQRTLRGALLASVHRMSAADLAASLLCLSRLGWPANDQVWLVAELEVALQAALIRALPALTPAAACYAGSALADMCPAPASPALLAALRPKLLQLLQAADASPGAIAQGVWMWRRLEAPVDDELGGAFEAALLLAMPAMNERQLGLITQAFTPGLQPSGAASHGGGRPGEVAEMPAAVACYH